MNIFSRVCSLVVLLQSLLKCSSIVLFLVMNACIFICFSYIFTVFLLEMCFVYPSDSDWFRIKMSIDDCNGV